MSEHDTYVVRQTKTGWVLLLNGQPLGSFAQRPEAERVTFRTAELSRLKSKVVEILAQDEHGNVRLIARTELGLIPGTNLRCWSNQPQEIQILPQHQRAIKQLEHSGAADDAIFAKCLL